MVNSKRIGSIDVMVASSVVRAGRAARDQVAGRHAPVADAARYRRAQLGEFEIELAWRTAASWAATVASATRLACVRWSKVCCGDGAAAHESLAARQVGLGVRRDWRAPARGWPAPAPAWPRRAGGRW